MLGRLLVQSAWIIITGEIPFGHLAACHPLQTLSLMWCRSNGGNKYRKFNKPRTISQHLTQANDGHSGAQCLMPRCLSSMWDIYIYIYIIYMGYATYFSIKISKEHSVLTLTSKWIGLRVRSYLPRSQGVRGLPHAVALLLVDTMSFLQGQTLDISLGLSNFFPNGPSLGYTLTLQVPMKIAPKSENHGFIMVY